MGFYKLSTVFALLAATAAAQTSTTEQSKVPRPDQSTIVRSGGAHGGEHPCRSHAER
jgi:hypothetical protein